MFNIKYADDGINWDDPNLISAIKDIERGKADKVIGKENYKQNQTVNTCIIQNGYTIWARQTIESAIFKKKPAVWFKIWFYIVNRTNHADNEKNGAKYKKGECFLKYEWIMSACAATKHEVKHCIEWLKKPYIRDTLSRGYPKRYLHPMIATDKGTRGFFVKPLTYNKYQDANNYKKGNTGTGKGKDAGFEKEHERNTINNNDKNYKEKKKILKEKKNVNFDNLPEFLKYKLTSPSNFERILAYFYVFCGYNFKDKWELMEQIKGDKGYYERDLQIIAKHADPVILQAMANLSEKGSFKLNECAGRLSTRQGKQSDKIDGVKADLADKMAM